MPNPDPVLPAAGLAALHSYIARGMSHIDDLQPARLLRLRSAMTLYDRLRFCVDEGEALSHAMFSPADLFALQEIAAEKPNERQAIEALADAIEEQLRHPPRDR